MKALGFNSLSVLDGEQQVAQQNQIAYTQTINLVEQFAQQAPDDSLTDRFARRKRIPDLFELFADARLPLDLADQLRPILGG